MLELNANYADNFWTIANAVTAFAIIQSITFLIAIGPGKGDLVPAIVAQRTLTAVAVFCAGAIYLGLLSYCQWANWTLLRAGGAHADLLGLIWYWNVVRLVAVFLSSAFCLPVVLTLESRAG